MQGKVLEFDLQKNKGLIISKSGNKYPFKASEWKSEKTLPQTGLEVEFMLEEESAIFIYPAKNISNNSQTKSDDKKSTRSIYGVVSFLAGLLGVIGFFYYAYNAKDVTYGFAYTIPALFAILTGHLATRGLLKSLGLILGYVVSLIYIFVIIIGTLLS